jgi:hypothetical protein
LGGQPPRPSSQTKPHHFLHQFVPVRGAVLAGMAKCYPRRGGRVGPVVPNPGDGGGGGRNAGPGGGLGGGVGVFHPPWPRAGSRDRPLPAPIDPLVEAHSRICPTCNMRIGSVPFPWFASTVGPGTTNKLGARA